MNFPNDTPQKKSRCGLYVGIGCLTLLLLTCIILIVGYFTLKSSIGRLLDEYTETQPMVLPQVKLSETEMETLQERFFSFRDNLLSDTSRPAEPLRLSAMEINALLQYAPEMSRFGDKIYIEMQNNRLKSQVSIPLGDFLPLLKGRYLNGTADLSIQMVQGRLYVHMESIEVAGQQIPQEVINEIRKENMAKEINDDPEVRKILDKIESIRIENDQLIVVPETP